MVSVTDSFSLKQPFKNTQKTILHARAVRNQAWALPFLSLSVPDRLLATVQLEQCLDPMGSNRFERSMNRETPKAQLKDQMLTHPELDADVSQIQF